MFRYYFKSLNSFNLTINFQDIIPNVGLQTFDCFWTYSFPNGIWFQYFKNILIKFYHVLENISIHWWFSDSSQKLLNEVLMLLLLLILLLVDLEVLALSKFWLLIHKFLLIPILHGLHWAQFLWIPGLSREVTKGMLIDGLGVDSESFLRVAIRLAFLPSVWINLFIQI